jgi:hypothetical protein
LVLRKTKTTAIITTAAITISKNLRVRGKKPKIIGRRR